MGRLTSGRGLVPRSLPVGESGGLVVQTRDEEEWLWQGKEDEGMK